MGSRRSDMRTWAEVDLGAVRRNAERIRARRPGKGLIGVLKADAYGHGALPLAFALEDAGVAMLGVGDSREAIELIRGGVSAPLIVLGAIIDGEMPAMIARDVRTTIHAMDRVELLEREAERQGKRHPVHLKIDSGMGRLGVMPERALEIAERIHASPHLLLEGIGTHCANSNLDLCDSTRRQLALFFALHRAVVERVGPIPMVHALNTAATWNLEVEDEVTTHVRIGAALYGIPGPTQRPYPFEPAMALRSQVIFLKDVPAGTPVGYNGTWTAPERSRLATLPLGYNDGLPPTSSQDGYVLIRGQRAPIRGVVSMDYVTVDVTRIENCRVGDEALLFGRSGDEDLPLRDVARIVGSSPYAITCGIGKRVHRVYRGARPREGALPAGFAVEAEAGA